MDKVSAPINTETPFSLKDAFKSPGKTSSASKKKTPVKLKNIAPKTIFDNNARSPAEIVNINLDGGAYGENYGSNPYNVYNPQNAKTE